ncbi:hypothetical protein Taro_043162 [Colocasia esculenta]|uniref:Uncharacterized protein n=1 Tax=Colocasia esculenta TaxID=4460 RepID=A0A843WIQ1_COLES|nr:hypothetical protein [Colocasia esculenta]
MAKFYAVSDRGSSGCPEKLLGSLQYAQGATSFEGEALRPLWCGRSLQPDRFTFGHPACRPGRGRGTATNRFPPLNKMLHHILTSFTLRW